MQCFIGDKLFDSAEATLVVDLGGFAKRSIYQMKESKKFVLVEAGKAKMISKKELKSELVRADKIQVYLQHFPKPELV